MRLVSCPRVGATIFVSCTFFALPRPCGMVLTPARSLRDRPTPPPTVPIPRSSHRRRRRRWTGRCGSTARRKSPVVRKGGSAGPLSRPPANVSTTSPKIQYGEMAKIGHGLCVCGGEEICRVRLWAREELPKEPVGVRTACGMFCLAWALEGLHKAAYLSSDVHHRIDSMTLFGRCDNVGGLCRLSLLMAVGRVLL